MDLTDKIEYATGLISQMVGRYKKPVLMSSFGKDSMVMMDIVERMGIKLPILFHREPFFPQKYEFSNRIIVEKNYTVYDYAPSLTQITKNGDVMEIVGRYQVGEKKFTWVPTGIKKPVEGQDFLCGYEDIYLKPCGGFAFPWDVALVGHKSTDIDPIIGAIPLRVDMKVNGGGCDFAYPLRYFSDADIWNYTEKFQVPFNEKRYDKSNGYREFEDITFNPDYHYACTRCIDRDEPDSVFCPRLNREISNRSEDVRYPVTVVTPGYIDR